MKATPEQQSKAAETRELAIYTRWLNGARCTAADLREIRPVIGEDQYRRSMEAIGENPEPLPADAPPIAPSFPLGRARPQKNLADYVETFSTGERQLKRYAKKGRESDPPDLPPFDDPAAFADWFARQYPNRKIPKKFLVLKLDAAKNGDKTEPPSSTLAPLDVTSLTLQKGASVEMAERYVVATHTQLLHGYSTGNDAIIRVWQPRFYEALDALRKAEASERQAAKIRGDLLPKAQFFSDFAALLEMLRMMKEDAGKRIRKLLGELPEGLGEKIQSTVDHEMEKQIDILRQMPGFKTVDDFKLALA